MTIELSKSVIDTLTCPLGRKDAIFYDSRLKGFAVRVTKGGAKIFLVQYSRGGQTKRWKIGTMGVITPAEARRRALELLGEIQGGADPKAEAETKRHAAVTAEADAKRQQAEQRESDAFTARVLLDRWCKINLAARSASYRREAPRAVLGLLGDKADEPAASLTGPRIQAVVDAKLDRTPVQVINATRYGRAAWNWALKRGLVVKNPFEAVVIERRVKSRDRVLSDSELAEAWRGTAGMAYPFGPVLRLIILTLQRRAEVAGMRWSELADGLTAWTIPAARAKNGRAHTVHLTAPAREILGAVKARLAGLIEKAEREGQAPPDSDLVFTTNQKTPVSGVQKARRALDKKIGAAREAAEDQSERRSPAIDWRLHDFRRTGVSKMAELGIPPHVADRILNHVSGSISGVAATYQRFEFMDQRKHALEAWAAHVLAVAAKTPADSNVLQLSAAKRQTSTKH